MSPYPAPKEPVPKDEVSASLKISRELGPDYDEAIASSLAERLDHAIDARISDQLNARQMHPGAHPEAPPVPRYAPAPAPKNGPSDNALRLTMGIVSLSLAIPLSAIGGSFAGPPGIVLAWIGIVTLFVVVVGVRRR